MEQGSSQEGVRTMCRPRIDYRPESHYCFGLSQKKLDDLTVMEHGGSLPGVSSNLSWSYDAGVGVMVLCNTSGVPVSTIADAAMRMYHGRTDRGPICLSGDGVGCGKEKGDVRHLPFR